MEKKEVLQKAYDRASHNLFCYSSNLLMTKAKQGYEKEWREALEECEILESMLKENKEPEITYMKLYDNKSIAQIRELLEREFRKDYEFSCKNSDHKNFKQAFENIIECLLDLNRLLIR